MLKCAIIGATGYTGMELIKILLSHSYVRITHLTTRSKESIPVRQLLPQLPKTVNLEIKNHDYAKIAKETDLVFVCLPHTEAMKAVQQFSQAGKVVIDLSADYRLKSAADYLKAYGKKHAYPALLKKAVYGLSEWNREKVSKADIISNPGCYPTGSALGMLPLLKAGLAEGREIIIDAKSGVSGAGKKLSEATSFMGLGQNFKAYKVNQHQHAPEIKQTLSTLSGKTASLNFVPHLLPIKRGILSVIYLKATKRASLKAIKDAFKKYYQDELFVRLKPSGEFPEIQDVCGTNYCDIGFTYDSHTKRIIIITAIDNLLKGASGQAVQNMNIRFGFPESEGLV